MSSKHPLPKPAAPLEPPRAKTRVAILIPHAADVKAGFAHDLALLVGFTVHNRPDINLRIFTGSSSLLPQIRARLVAEALDADCTHALLLDSDMRFPASTLLRLLEHEAPIVAANYTTRAMPPRPVAIASVADKRLLYTEAGATGATPAEVVGLGCCLVDLDVFRTLSEPWFMVGYSPVAGEYLGEDVYFCGKARDEAGLTILVDHALSLQVAHVGELEYRHEHALALRDQDRQAPEGVVGGTP